MKKFLTKAFLKECAHVLLCFAVGAIIGAVCTLAIRLLLDRVEVKWNPERNYTHCSAPNVDNYYFQKLLH